MTNRTTWCRIYVLQDVVWGGCMQEKLDLTMGKIESQFADIIWSKEPISASGLSEIGKDTFGWKKTTTFTVIKRLCDKGIFKKEDGFIKANIKRDMFYSMQSQQFVEDKFQGSLPAFLASFVKGKRFTSEEIEQLQELISHCDD